MSKTVHTPIRPGLAALRIWVLTIFTGPLLFLLANWLVELRGSRIPALQVGMPDPLSLYSSLLAVGAVLGVLPCLITWALLASWKRRRLSAQTMGERLLLLNLLFTAAGIVFLMGQIDTQHPLKNAVLLLVPYFLAGVLGIIRVLGWPWRG